MRELEEGARFFDSDFDNTLFYPTRYSLHDSLSFRPF
jgi:hypothetical protein